MRDIPFFSTETGVSALTLKEIPYRKTAYIRILELQPQGLTAHVAECLAFCRMAGAEEIFAGGDDGLESWPLYTTVVEMGATAWVDPEKLAALFPVTEKTAARWREYYNRRMAQVPGAATLEARDEQRIADSGGAYFVHDNGALLGIGWLEDCRLLAMAAEPGQGQRVMHSLMSLVEGARMTLEVASANARAVGLYEKLGFLAAREVMRWYRVG